MDIDVKNFPEILCGPILRRVELQRVSVFIATKQNHTLELELYKGYRKATDNLKREHISSQHEMERLGKHLYVSVITLELSQSNLLDPETIYSYNIFFDAQKSSSNPGISVRDISTKSLYENLLIKNGESGNNGHCPLGFKKNYLPSFSTPPNDITNLNLFHGSCRKPHGEGPDMLAAIDDYLESNYTEPTKRPHMMLMTGDQIYADDVEPTLLKILHDTANALLGWTEEFSGCVTPTPDWFKELEGTFFNDIGNFNGIGNEISEKQIKNYRAAEVKILSEKVQEKIELAKIKWGGTNKTSPFEMSSTDSIITYLNSNDFLPLFASGEDEEVNKAKRKLLFIKKIVVATRKLCSAIRSDQRWDEYFRHIDYTNDSIPTLTLANRISPPQREKDLKELCRLTSDHMSAHLMFLGEFYMMYLFTWSDALWPRNLTNLDIDENIRTFFDTLPKVRRVMANVPIMMMFDDHEVTDDWNIHEKWVERVNSSPMGPQFLRNALCAYAVFQDWGNQPDDYAEGMNGREILKALTVSVSENNIVSSPAIHSTKNRHIDRLFGVGTVFKRVQWEFSGDKPDDIAFVKSEDARKQWDWEYSGNGTFKIITLDTRTQRGYSPWNTAILIRPEELYRQLEGRLQADQVNIVVSPAPVMGVPLVEESLQPLFRIKDQLINMSHGRKTTFLALRYNSWLASVESQDFESWLANEAGFNAISKSLTGEGRQTILLSGDVHYAYSNKMELKKDNGEGTVFQLMQFCSSSMKHQDFKTKELGYSGWIATRRPAVIDILTLLFMQAAVVEARDLGFDLNSIPKKFINNKYKIHFLRDRRNLDEIIRKTNEANGKSPPVTRNDMVEAGIAVTSLRSEIVGHNNVARLNFTKSGTKHLKVAQHLYWSPIKDWLIETIHKDQD